MQELQDNLPSKVLLIRDYDARGFVILTNAWNGPRAERLARDKARSCAIIRWEKYQLFCTV